MKRTIAFTLTAIAIMAAAALAAQPWQPPNGTYELVGVFEPPNQGPFYMVVKIEDGVLTIIEPEHDPETLDWHGPMQFFSGAGGGGGSITLQFYDNATFGYHDTATGAIARGTVTYVFGQ